MLLAIRVPEPVAEWRVLLADRATDADSVYSQIAGTLRIRQSPIPLAAYTLRTSLGTAVHFGIAMGVAVVAVGVLHPTDHLTPLYALWAVVPAVLTVSD